MTMWYHRVHAGEPVTFLLQSPDGTTADVAVYLDELCRALQGEEPVNIIAERVYRPLVVYVSLLEDPNSEPVSLDDDMETLPDEWMPLYLATVMEHAEAVAALLTFHQQYAITVLEDILQQSNTTFLLERVVDEEVAPASNGENISSESFMHKQGRLMECQVRSELGGAIVLLRSGENINVEEQNTLHPGVSWITSVLKPLLKCILYERHYASDHKEHNEENSFVLGFATRIVQAHCNALAKYHTQLPCLIVDHNVLYDACHGDITILSDILELFCGLLLPVVFGKYISPTDDNITGKITNTTPDEAISSSRVSCRIQSARRPFLLSLAAQEHQRLAFLVMWSTYREKKLRERSPLGSTVERHEVNVLNEFQIALQNCKKNEYVTPLGSIWSGHLFVLSRLISQDCTLEQFIDVMKGDYVSCSAGMPLAFIVVMVAGAVVSALLKKSHCVQLICTKVEILLLADVPGVSSPLRQYLLASPVTHAKRFEELWLAETSFSPAKKFESRGEMLYFTLVELVTLSAETLWKTPDVLANSREREEIQCSLGNWLSICCKFFTGLGDQSFSGKYGQPELQSSAQSDTTTNEEDTAGENERDVMRRLCAVMRLRLQQGSPPLPSIYAIIYRGETTATGTSDDGAGDSVTKENSDEDIKSAFEDAQALFSIMAPGTSDSTKLKFYGLYKQATIGDINVSKPWVMDPVGRAKWEAWNKLKGMDLEKAMQEYVLELRALQASHGGTGT